LVYKTPLIVYTLTKRGITMDFGTFLLDHYNVTPDMRITYFGTEHIIWLSALVIGMIMISLVYRNLTERQRPGFKKGFAWFIILLEIIRQVIYLAMGRYRLEYLPFHLCGITEMTIFIYAYTGNKTAKESLYALGIVGALMALVFADWLDLPLWNFHSIQAFIIHGSLIAYVLMLVVSGELKPEVKRLPKVLLIHLGLFAATFFFNKQFDTNFFFSNAPSPGSPLELFEQIAGNPGYNLITFGLVIIVWIVLYGPWLIFGREKKTYKYNYKEVRNPKY
jgi:hypothetical integral membrane protein (TIGR02206 family)